MNNIIATNLRFPVNEYKEIKLLAFSENRSVSALVRHAVSLYKKQRLTSSAKVKLAERFKKATIRIDTPVLDLVKVGRKFE